MYWVMSFQRWTYRLFLQAPGRLHPLQALVKEGIEGLADPRDRPPVPHHHMVLLTGPTWDPGPGVLLWMLGNLGENSLM